jgi:hypothetical protein
MPEWCLTVCSVVAWEPVPTFRALLSFNVAVNKVTHLVTVRDRVVADNPGGKQVNKLPYGGRGAVLDSGLV